MKVETLTVGLLETNCYLIDHGGYLLIVDPGDEFEKIERQVGNRKVLAILITHYHEDHIGALEKIKKRYSVPVYDFYTKEKKITIGPFTFDMICNPGHTKDSVRFCFEKEMIMFVGDFIFKGSIGRCDLGGNEMDMKKSLQEIKKYENITLYPGHGQKTTIDEEKKNNPFFQCFS